MIRRISFLLLLAITPCLAQNAREPITSIVPFSSEQKASEQQAASPSAPSAPPPATVPADDTTLKPSWETQTKAGTYLLGIPAPRGQITDRNGNPLAQTRVSYNLALVFPPSRELTETNVLGFARQQIALAKKLTERDIAVTDEQVLKHFRNRRVVPLDIAFDVLPTDIEAIKKRSPENLMLRAVYQRFYPDGKLAGQIIGYAGRTGRTPDSPLQNNDLLWPNSEGREGLEQAFNEQLNGKPGQLNLTIDASGSKASEKIVVPPLPGYNVVTTLDEDIQRLTEQVLSKGATRGAIVIVDPNNGDILAMASQPCFNPNAFVPSISASAFKALQDDPNIPLLPRAFRSAYPPGSTFKVVVGLAALESGKIHLDDEFACPAAMEIGNLTFHNWKKENAGSLTFVGALTQSCDTWFYQAGIKTGSAPIIDWAQRMGLGVKTGIPLASEADGRVPTNEYMKKLYGRKMLDGDLANLSIGQGDLLVTPLQMAQAMAVVANGGTLYQTRLVQQVQSADGQIVAAYSVRAKDQIAIRPETLAALKKAMVQVVSSPMGTAGKAEVPGVALAGKTGTAQWGPKKNERLAAWFAGFVPADKPKYAFAALYESEPRQTGIHGGTYAAPMIGKIMGELFKDATKGKKAKPKPKKPEPVEQD
jgi:penicillin-binding protein 2